MAAMMTETTTTRKPRKAYYGFLYEDHGILTQDDAGQVWFRNSETDELTAITPEHMNFLSVNGEVGLCETQLLADLRRGGPVTIATTREMGVA
jgi:hypothetical protein